MKTMAFVAKLAATACLLVSAAAHADRWNFVFHDLHNVYTDLTNGAVTDYGFVSLHGFFLADDFNHDGLINLSEVQLVSLGGTDFNKAAGEIASFSYGGGNLLSLTAYGYRVDLSTAGGLTYGSGGYIDAYSVNARSYITVVAAPVPEVSTSILLIAGLCGIGGLTTARRRHS